jgi:hypothetical protein
VGGTYIHERIRKLVDAADPADRACYLMSEYHGRTNEEIGYWLNLEAEEVVRRRDEITRQIERTEHQDVYKDWPLVQKLIDAGASEIEVKEMICISQAGWDAAKRRGDVHV